LIQAMNDGIQKGGKSEEIGRNDLTALGKTN
jgi:hypothetical protein